MDKSKLMSTSCTFKTSFLINGAQFQIAAESSFALRNRSDARTQDSSALHCCSHLPSLTLNFPLLSCWNFSANQMSTNILDSLYFNLFNI